MKKTVVPFVLIIILIVTTCLLSNNKTVQMKSYDGYHELSEVDAKEFISAFKKAKQDESFIRYTQDNGNPFKDDDVFYGGSVGEFIISNVFSREEIIVDIGYIRIDGKFYLLDSFNYFYDVCRKLCQDTYEYYKINDPYYCLFDFDIDQAYIFGNKENNYFNNLAAVSGKLNLKDIANILDDDLPNISINNLFKDKEINETVEYKNKYNYQIKKISNQNDEYLLRCDAFSKQENLDEFRNMFQKTYIEHESRGME